MIVPATLSRKGDWLLVRCAYEDRIAVATLPAAGWSKVERAWAFPATPAAAKSLLRVVGSSDLLEEVKGPDPQDAHETPLPWDSVTYAPWKHQLRGANWLADRRAALLQFGLGTGKSRCAIEAARLVGAKRVLVICPRSVIPVWPLQASLHGGDHFGSWTADERYSVLQRARRMRETLSIRCDKPTIYVLNYDAAWRDPMAALLLGQEWDIVIWDEIHALKAAGSKRSKFGEKLRRATKRVWGLSGTPLTQSPLDAYGIFRALDPGVFGTNFSSFRNRYAVLGGFQGHQVLGYRNGDDFRRQYFSLTLAQDRSVLDLPEATHINVPIELPPSAKSAYTQLRNEYSVDFADGAQLTAVHALTRLLRLQQLTSGSVPVDVEGVSEQRDIHTEKEEALGELLDQLDSTEPAVVFCRFRADIERAKRAAISAGRVAMELSGAENQLAEWQSANGGEVLVAQIQSGSEGIDLTRAAYTFYFSVPLSLAQYEQSQARTHRPGQQRPVFYYHLIAKGTVDTYIYRLLRNRREVIDTILQEGLKDE